MADMYDVFISYSSLDNSEAYSMKSVLTTNGLTCWMAPESIPPGEDYASCIVDAINGCSVFLLMLSTNAQRSVHVRKELDLAVNARKVILPFMLEDCPIEKSFNYFLTNVERMLAYINKEEANRKLIKRIYDILGRTPPSGIDSAVTPDMLKATTQTATPTPVSTEPVPPQRPTISMAIPTPDPRNTPYTIWIVTDPLTGKHGLFDSKGEVRCSPIWDEVKRVADDRFAVKMGELWGLIDDCGNVLLQPKYEKIHHFQNNRSCVKLNSKFGMIDQNGCEVVPPIYNVIYTSLDGIHFIAQKTVYSMLKVFEKTGYGIIDRNGREVVPFIWDDLDDADEGLCQAEQAGKFGFIDYTGKTVIPFIWDDASYILSEGLIAVKKDTKWGYIDYSGNLIIPCIWDTALAFTNGLAAVSQNGMHGYIDHTGKILISLAYDNCRDFGHQHHAIVRKNKKYGMIDRTGKQTIPCLFLNISPLYSIPYAIVKDHYLDGLYHVDGTRIIPCFYEEITQSTRTDAVKVKNHGQWGVCDLTGREIISCHYDDLRLQIDTIPLAVSKQGNKWGAVNLADKTVIPFEWDAIGNFIPGGVTWACQNGKFHLIDTMGKVLR